MSDVNLDAVRARLEQLRADPTWPRSVGEMGKIMTEALKNCAWLLGEVERLRTEIARLRDMWVPVCRDTGEPASRGICPVHGGDGCLLSSGWLRDKQRLANSQAREATLERALAQARGSLPALLNDLSAMPTMDHNAGQWEGYRLGRMACVKLDDVLAMVKRALAAPGAGA